MTIEPVETDVTETDVIVIGSGIGGLCCGALLARYGFEVTICESHSIPGGAAHGFDRNGFKFDSGPSLYSGLSYSPSANPLRQVLDALEQDLPWLTYDTWGCCLPEGNFDTTVGTDQFCDVLAQFAGPTAVREWQQLQRVMAPYGRAATALSPAAVRLDWGALLTLGRTVPTMLQHAPSIPKLIGSFDRIMDGVVTDPFLRNWLNLLCFLLSGLPASETSAAEVAFMFADWYRPGVKLDYPVGGSGALVDALVRGLEQFGGKLRRSAHVEQLLVQNDRAVGVQLRNGQTLRARRAVVSNASVWDTLKLIPAGDCPNWIDRSAKLPPSAIVFCTCTWALMGQDCDRIWPATPLWSTTGSWELPLPKTWSWSRFPRCWMRPWLPLASTSSMFTLPPTNLTPSGKDWIARVQPTLPKSRSARR